MRLVTSHGRPLEPPLGIDVHLGLPGPAGITVNPGTSGDGPFLVLRGGRSRAQLDADSAPSHAARAGTWRALGDAAHQIAAACRDLAERAGEQFDPADAEPAAARETRDAREAAAVLEEENAQLTAALRQYAEGEIGTAVAKNVLTRLGLLGRE